MADDTNALSGRRILVVEDEYFLAKEIAKAFQAEGAQVVGPVPTVEQALALVAGSEPLDGAVLDINLRGEMVFPVADALERRGVPFVFTSGYDAGALPERYAKVTLHEKPIEPAKIASSLFA